jgi:hypothetical protein
MLFLLGAEFFEAHEAGSFDVHHEELTWRKTS